MLCLNLLLVCAQIHCFFLSFFYSILFIIHFVIIQLYFWLFICLYSLFISFFRYPSPAVLLVAIFDFKPPPLFVMSHVIVYWIFFSLIIFVIFILFYFLTTLGSSLYLFHSIVLIFYSPCVLFLWYFLFDYYISVWLCVFYCFILCLTQWVNHNWTEESFFENCGYITLNYNSSFSSILILTHLKGNCH